jgi:hypothetical protein
MDPGTLNKDHIEIIEMKHSSDLIDLYQISYDPETKILTLQPKDREFDFGSENSINVKIDGSVKTQAGKAVGADYNWSFKTKPRKFN